MSFSLCHSLQLLWLITNFSCYKQPKSVACAVVACAVVACAVVACAVVACAVVACAAVACAVVACAVVACAVVACAVVACAVVACAAVAVVQCSSVTVFYRLLFLHSHKVCRRRFSSFCLPSFTFVGGKQFFDIKSLGAGALL